jgi:hypothetical protein
MSTVRKKELAALRESLRKIEALLAAANGEDSSCAVFHLSPWDDGDWTEAQRQAVRLYVDTWIRTPLVAAIDGIEGNRDSHLNDPSTEARRRERERIYGRPTDGLEVIAWSWRNGSVHLEIRLAHFPDADGNVMTHVDNPKGMTRALCGTDYFGRTSATGNGDLAKVDCPECRSMIAGLRFAPIT